MERAAKQGLGAASITAGIIAIIKYQTLPAIVIGITLIGFGFWLAIKMNSKEFEKNKLDLIYQKNLQKLNAVLAFGMVGAITVLAAFVTNPQALLQTFLTLVVVVIVAFVFYKKISKKIDDLIEKNREIKIKFMEVMKNRLV